MEEKIEKEIEKLACNYAEGYEQRLEKLFDLFNREYQKVREDDSFTSDEQREKYILKILWNRFGKLNIWKRSYLLGVPIEEIYYY